VVNTGLLCSVAREPSWLQQISKVWSPGFTYVWQWAPGMEKQVEGVHGATKPAVLNHLVPKWQWRSCGLFGSECGLPVPQQLLQAQEALACRQWEP
jgi:hypothetical protein